MVRVKVRLGARVRVRTVARLALGVCGRLAAGLEELRDHEHPGKDLGHVADDVRLVRVGVRIGVRVGVGVG
eukprot:scaffold103289_cov18-Phaeocystis_antarctica.AAC.1